MTLEPLTPPIQTPKRSLQPVIFDLLLILVLLLGAYFRFVGLDWGEYQYLHPDERFLVWVGSDITPFKCTDPTKPIEACPPEQRTWMSFSDYFNASTSNLNPVNRGHGFYVYGTLPMFLTRYVVQWVYGQSGFMEMTNVGRLLSALADLLAVFLVYLLGARLYNRKVGLLAAAFSAATVLQIQQSHFFTMDTFINLFTLLAFYFAARVLLATDPPGEQSSLPGNRSRFISSPFFVLSIGFGLALGMAVASKLNAAPMAIALPLAFGLRLLAIPPEERRDSTASAIGYLALAAFVSLLAFRIFQPYAFSGPGFFGLKFDPRWLANMNELRSQTSRDVDMPPAMQWARRPLWFSGENLVEWGLGLPLGILACVGFLWATWRTIKTWGKTGDEWQRHALLIAWTGLYFGWQSLAPNPTMRYQLPIYPMLEIFAAWAVVRLLESPIKKLDGANLRNALRNAKPFLGGLVAAVALIATFAWAFAFTRIYTRPITRIEASRWIYQNIPGPINLHIQTGSGTYSQPVPFPYNSSITPGFPFQTSFKPTVAGSLNEVFIAHAVDRSGIKQARTLDLVISAQPDGSQPLARATLSTAFTARQDSRGQGYTLTLDRPVPVNPDQTYFMKMSLNGDQVMAMANGALTLHIQPQNDPNGSTILQSLDSLAADLNPNMPYETNFSANSDGLLSQVSLQYLAGISPNSSPITLTLSLANAGESQPLATSTLQIHSTPQPDPEAPGTVFTLDQPLLLAKGGNYTLSLELTSNNGEVRLAGDTLANEGEWDDGLPLRVDNHDAMSGIYPPDINFNMYWDDNSQKLDRFYRILNESDYIVISSNRQWGSLPRIPERFPMTAVYYRNLLGCPADKDIVWCYRVAQPGSFQGNLGYDLVKVFQSDPSIGSVRINDQFAEEAFTVYDHPKVMVFKKNQAYSAQKVASLLGAVDFSKVIRVPPLKAPAHPTDLMLPTDRESEQLAGGTWSQLFDPQALQNRFQLVGVLVWYLSVFLLGLFIYPFLRLAFPGLSDKGYPLARTAGLLILSYLVWLGGSVAPFTLPFNRLTISAALALIALAGSLLAYNQRLELRQELRQRGKYFLIVEGVALAFFLLDLLVRFGNPDLWHPFKGGEKPMDFSFFNAVLKSSSFPPYDPWFAGGYLNYYYYGFVLVGVLVKWLGIIPSIAYNLILPTIFSLIGLGAFSIAWNLYSAVGKNTIANKPPSLRSRNPSGNGGTSFSGPPMDGPAALQITSAGEAVMAIGSTAPSQVAPVIDQPAPGYQAESGHLPAAFDLQPLWAGMAGAVGMAALGNLGTVRMILQGWEKLAAPGGIIENAGLLTRWAWALRGFFLALGGQSLPYGIDSWYWDPSRIMPPGDYAITEFPSFTMLYADPHAHLFALPLALLALAFALAVILGGGRWRNLLGVAAGFGLGGLAIGVLRPTNTWDFPTYLALGVVAVGYALYKNFSPSPRLRRIPFLTNLPENVLRLLVTAAGIALLVLLSIAFFEPYAHWYGLGYSSIELWKDVRTPVSSYLTHWGLFLFVIVSWMVWETRDWMAKTPLSALRKLEPYQEMIWSLAALLVAAVGSLLVLKVAIAWIALPLAAWALVLILRPDQPDVKRFVLFLVGTGLILTLMVELVVLKGDIGRMNTVFKFYLQVWTLFAVCAAAALGWLLQALPEWLPAWRNTWKVVLAVLAFGAALYPLMAGMAKVQDRMVTSAPHTLDGMLYMDYATYDWQGPMDLSQDYRAIRWMQEHVQGSPVIVEANLRDLYRWGSRFTIYTGLPGVVGWEWQEQQQRALVPGSWISNRIQEVDDFYTTTDLDAARSFLQKYGVRYIIVGQLEHNHYPGPGLDKFPAADGVLWNRVYQDGSTAIYEVKGN